MIIKMTKKWLKILQKENNRLEILENIKQILEWDFNNLDIIKMKWYDNYFRCRIWKIRIVFFEKDWKYFVDKIGYRGDVYKWN